MTQSLASNSKCYVGFINNEPVAIVAANRFPHPTNKNIVKIGRVVVLPHWQGYGIGMKMVEEIVEKEYSENDVRFSTTLPIMHNYLWSSPDKWRLKFQGTRKASDAGNNAGMSRGVREVYMETYQYVNEQYKDDSINRVRVPREQRKEYPTMGTRYSRCPW